MSEKILFVDDEANILEAYRRTLRKQFKIETAQSGAEALVKVQSGGPYAVVVSDMRMPEMDGIEFLSEMKKISPETIRIMLTGNADQQTAIDAVNTGEVFHFLNKPCSADLMAASIKGALNKHQLDSVEKDLLENTVKGSIAALTDVLSLAAPEMFGRALRYRQLMAGCVEKLKIQDNWQMETLSMLSLIGTISLPEELVHVAMVGGSLSDEERKLYDQHPSLGAMIVSEIPRLEKIAEAIKYQRIDFDGSNAHDTNIKGKKIPLGARLLRAIVDFEIAERTEVSTKVALSKMKRLHNVYDPEILDTLYEITDKAPGSSVIEISIMNLKENMVLASDVRTKEGTLLVCKGQTVSPSVNERLVNFWHNGSISEYIVIETGIDNSENPEAIVETDEGDRNL